METKQPTQGQIKEFWEWCGCKLVNGHDYYYWLFLDRSTIKGAAEPDIDLNNLFKYAVPLIIQHILKVYRPKWNKDSALSYIFDLWDNKIRGGKDYPTALFETLDAIRKY